MRLAPATERATGRGSATRRLALAVAGVVLLAAAFLLGRMTVPAAVADAPQQAVADDAAAPVAAEADPGPARVVDEVPVGYAHTEQGAVLAATNYLSAIGDKRAFSQVWRERAYRAMAAPEAVEELLDSVDASYDRIADDLALNDAAAYDGSVLAVTLPVGYRVDSYQADRATVTVWAAGWLTRLTGEQLPLRAQTSTIELVWTDDDWKLSGVSGIEPLDPPGVAAPVTADALAEMRGFYAYEYEPQEQP